MTAGLGKVDLMLTQVPLCQGNIDSDALDLQINTFITVIIQIERESFIFVEFSSYVNILPTN